MKINMIRMDNSKKKGDKDFPIADIKINKNSTIAYINIKHFSFIIKSSESDHMDINLWIIRLINFFKSNLIFFDKLNKTRKMIIYYDGFDTEEQIIISYVLTISGLSVTYNDRLSKIIPWEIFLNKIIDEEWRIEFL